MTEDQTRDSVIEESRERFAWDPGGDGQYADAETPLVVVPRGGTREVGRSCYEVQTPDGRYLVDCGLKQKNQPDQRGADELDGSVAFPDFRGIESETIDAVLVTHAHIDHTGALPILEADNLLNPAAPVLCTRPTASLMHELLLDSVGIHKNRSERMSFDPRFDRDDVHNLLERTVPLDYEEDALSSHVPVDSESLQFRFGNASHLLGSAWISLERDGRRVLFSGDVGGRSAHLPGVESPPAVDTMFLESTYGDKDNHGNVDDARTEIYNAIIDAVERDIPVLLPTFAVGRAQELLQLIRERWRDLDDETRDGFEVVYDGMVEDATNMYHAFGVGQWVADTINRYRSNAADHTPFEPDCAWTPTDSDERATVFDGDRTPVVISSSGMLTGGPSPAYLLDLVRNYEEGRIIITGYQARGTPGRKLVDTGGDTVTLTVAATPTDGDATDTADEGRPRHEVEVPRDWVKSMGGLSGHVARNSLLEFAREADPDHLALVHGPGDAQEEMQSYMDGNMPGTNVTRTKVHRPIPVHPTGAIEVEPVLDEIAADEEDSSEQLAEPTGDLETQELIEQFKTRQQVLATELAAERNDAGYTEAELREMIRQEVQSVLQDALSQYQIEK